MIIKPATVFINVTSSVDLVQRAPQMKIFVAKKSKNKRTTILMSDWGSPGKT